MVEWLTLGVIGIIARELMKSDEEKEEELLEEIDEAIEEDAKELPAVSEKTREPRKRKKTFWVDAVEVMEVEKETPVRVKLVQEEELDEEELIEVVEKKIDTDLNAQEINELEEIEDEIKEE